VIDLLQATRDQVARQVAHWRAATDALEDPENFASAPAWASLERYLGLALRGHLTDRVLRLKREADAMRVQLRAARNLEELDELRQRVVRFRAQYIAAEAVVEFFGDAVGSRANPRMSALLAACDRIAARSMQQLLDPLGHVTVPALVFIERGLGAAILRANAYWDPSSVNPVAAIKLTRHNILRPTSLTHETGHQVAAITGWTQEFASAAAQELADEPMVAAAWSGWSSEIVADAFSVALTGYASVAALHDVVAGDDESVFRQLPGDPHPVAFCRVLLGVELVNRATGPVGPQADLAASWVRSHPLENATPSVAELMRRSLPLLPKIADLCLVRPMKAFGGRSLTDIIDPTRVSADALAQLEREAGDALFTSPHWLDRECVRLVALSGLRAATGGGRLGEAIEQQEEWMLRLGHGLRAAAA
jgi:hypothetical protein